MYETAYRPVTTVETREVPVTSYDTEYKVEDEIEFVEEYEKRTKDVPINRVIVGNHSSDFGDNFDGNFSSDSSSDSVDSDFSTGLLHEGALNKFNNSLSYYL